ncbi:MAG TPA: inositol monophosphatase family protein [Elusimicrobiota bacterium]|nr:inositol monophosphatase family protein [Elusimicrobiota bacterium]
MGPLTGETVVVLRPRGRTAPLVARLEALGARVHAIPAVKIEPPRSWTPLDRALRSLGAYDAIAFSSASGVEAFFRRAGKRPKPPARVFAVGPATAAALAERGWKAAPAPRNGGGEALARSMGRVRGLRVLLPRAESGRRELAQALRAAGARVDEAPAYRTVFDPAGARAIRALLESAGHPWVVFASGSQVSAFLAAAGAGARPFFQRARAASIGSATSAALRRAGIEPALEAPETSSRSLAAALAARAAAEKPDLRALETTLRAALLKGGRVLRESFGRVRVRYKGRGNPVTDADHASEEAVLRTILARFPDHDFLTEERAPKRTGSPFHWVIDPLDGTANYAHGCPNSCVSIGLVHRGAPLVGGVYDPFRDELFLARRGGGTTLNGRPIRASATRRLEQSLLVTGFAYDRQKRAAFYTAFCRDFLESGQDLRRSGSAALDLAWVAAGRYEGFWEFRLNPWDVAAGMLLVSEAGGKVTDFAGRPWSGVADFGAQTLATNGRVHGQMLRVIQKRL